MVRRRKAPNPPSFIPTPDLGHKFRFIAGTTTTNAPITRKMLLSLMFTAGSTSSGYRMFGAVQLRRVNIWSPIVATFQPITVGLEFPGPYSPSTLKSDSSAGLMPAHVSVTPPRNSFAALWSIGGSNESDVVFSVTAPQGAIIDVELAVRLIDRESATTVGDTLSGVVLGTVYYGRLDGNASGVLLAGGGVTAY